MFSTDFIFRQQENLVDNQKCWAGFRPLCNKILFQLDNFSLMDVREFILVVEFRTVLLTLYNTILRIARNFLETRENIKISTHPFYHVNLD